jgi:hypothetical protein
MSKSKQKMTSSLSYKFNMKSGLGLSRRKSPRRAAGPKNPLDKERGLSYITKKKKRAWKAWNKLREMTPKRAMKAWPKRETAGLSGPFLLGSGNGFGR